MNKFFQENKFNILEWPSCSPDLKVIENTWKMISDKVYEASQPKRIEHLKALINDAVLYVNNNTNDIIVNLYNTFRCRLTNVLKSGRKLIQDV